MQEVVTDHSTPESAMAVP